MRLPMRNVFRAFRELDPFSDEVCERYVEQARRSARHAPQREDRVFVGLVTLGVIACVAVLGPAFTRLMNWVYGFDGTGMWPRAVPAGTAILALAVGVALLRDARLRSLVRRRLNTDACDACGHTLLGAVCRWGDMVCPGCGAGFSPLAAGLTPEDLLSRESAMDGLSVPLKVRCPHCPATMEGVPIVDGKVRCGQCVAHYSVTLLNLSHADFQRGRILDAMEGHGWPCEHQCPGCRYSTRGLIVTGGRVRCPECNLNTAVRKLSLGREEFLALAKTAGVGPSSPPAPHNAP